MKPYGLYLRLHNLQYKMDKDVVYILQIPEANAAYPAIGAL